MPWRPRDGALASRAARHNAWAGSSASNASCRGVCATDAVAFGESVGWVSTPPSRLLALEIAAARQTGSCAMLGGAYPISPTRCGGRRCRRRPAIAILRLSANRFRAYAATTSRPTLPTTVSGVAHHRALLSTLTRLGDALSSCGPRFPFAPRPFSLSLPPRLESCPPTTPAHLSHIDPPVLTVPARSLSILSRVSSRPGEKPAKHPRHIRKGETGIWLRRTSSRAPGVESGRGHDWTSLPPFLFALRPISAAPSPSRHPSPSHSLLSSVAPLPVPTPLRSPTRPHGLSHVHSLWSMLAVGRGNGRSE